MSRAAFAAKLTAVTVFFIVAVVAVFTAPTTREQPVSYYETQAQCIAEYDYANPERTTIDNLEAALQLCR